MMVKGTGGELSASPDDSLAETVDELDASVSTAQHQLHQEPLTKSTRHKLKLTSSGTRMWRNISRKRSASHGSSKVTTSNMANELVIEDSDVILQDSVLLTNCLQTHQRYLFLLRNVLVLAKQKSSANFHAKDEIRLSEIWLADCVDQVSELICDHERSFVIGWPTVNMVATFASAQLKDVWLNKLQQQIALEKSKEWPPNVVIKIISASEAFSVTKSLLVQNYDEARDILSRCVQEMHISSASVNDFQFWVQSEKENHPYPLFGHEYPYAIQMNYIREKQGSSESVALMDTGLFDGLKFQIMRKQSRSKLSLKLSLDETRTTKKTSKILKLFTKSSRSVEVGNIFGRDLSSLVNDDTLCPPVMDILSHLFVHGPFAVDIFRKSAIVSKCHDAKQHLDQGDKVDFDSLHVGVSAALLKELLRCLPNCLLLCELYSKWIKISAVLDNQTLANHRLKSLVENLPPSHRIFLRYLMCILHHISLRSYHNGMTARCLSVCISPSLLWPRSSSGAALSQVNDAKKLNAVVEQMIDAAGEIFGPDCLHLFDHLIPKWNRSKDVVAKFGQRTNLSLDIVKEESLVGGVEQQEVDTTLSSFASGICSTDMTPTSPCYNSGLATSNSSSYSDFTVTNNVVDRLPFAETSNDTEQSAITASSPVTCISSVEMKKCKFEGISGWFHLAFEDDSPFQSHLENSYLKPDEGCSCSLESCVSDVNRRGRNLSAEIISETELVVTAILDSLNTSVTEFHSKPEKLAGTERANESADFGALDTSPSLDVRWKDGLGIEQEVEKIDISVFGVEQDSSALNSEAHKPSEPNLRSVSSADDFQNPSSETVSLSYPSTSSAHFQEQTLSDAPLSFDVPDPEHTKRCEGRTEFVAEAGCLPEPDKNKDEILSTQLSFRDILRSEQTPACVNSSAARSKANSLNLRRGMTKCGSDIFPKCFLEGLHCTIGEVLLSSKCEEEQITGKNCGLTQTKSSVLLPQMGIPHQAIVRPRACVSGGQQFNSVWCQVAPCSYNSENRIRPAKPPSYAEAMAAKAQQNGACSLYPSGQNVAGFTSHLPITKGHPVPSVVSKDRNEESGFSAVPSVKSIINYDCSATVPAATVVTCSIPSHAPLSNLNVIGTYIDSSIHVIPIACSKTISAVSANSETLVTCEQNRTNSQHGECNSKPLANQNSDMPSQLSCDLKMLPPKPLIGSVFMSTNYSSCSVNCLSQANSKVRNENAQLQNGVCAFMAKQRLNQKVKVRKHRQHSSDPKLRTRRAFGIGLGRSKSDSCEILNKKRQECIDDKEKENVLVSSNSFLKRKLAAMKQASKEEECKNATLSSSNDQCTASFNLPVVSEENSTCADDAVRESAYSPRDMKKKKSLLFERHDRQNDESTIHSSPLRALRLSNSLQHEMREFNDNEFGEVRVKTDLPLYRKIFNVPQSKSFEENCFPSESYCSALDSSEEQDSSVLKSSSVSTLSPERYSFLFRAAKIPIPDALKINWSVSKLKQMYSKRGVPQSGSVADPLRMIALHDSPYFV